jgi:hypothetical protein
MILATLVVTIVARNGAAGRPAINVSRYNFARLKDATDAQEAFEKTQMGSVNMTVYFTIIQCVLSE